MKRVQELLHGQSNANENNGNNQKSSDEILIRDQIPNTPFTIIGGDDIGYFTTMGKYRLTTPTKTYKEQKEQIENMDWTLIMNVIIAATNQIIEINHKNNK